MLRHWIYFVCFSVFALITSYDLQAYSPLYDNLVIEKINVEIVNVPADYYFNKQAVLAKIKTREKDLFSQSDFDNDLKVLSCEYDRVEPIVDIVNDNIHITIKLTPKPLVRGIFWHGNERITNKCLREELKINSCSVFDRLEFNKAFHKLKTYYVKKGFFEVELDYEIILDAQTNEVDIHIHIQEGRAGRIQKIHFLNFTTDEEDELCEKMLTKTYSFFFSWINDQGTYNEDMVQQDQFTILNYLHNRGYADARVYIDITEAKECDRIILTIVADKGQRYYFDKLTIEGNTIICAQDIFNTFCIRPGAPYSPEKLAETVQNITNLYGRFGYIDTIVNYEPINGCEDYLYNVNFTIEEGEQYRVGLIKVIGNCSTQTNVILHETLLYPGEIFNTEKLQKSEERLRNVGFFKYVNVYAVKSDSPCLLGDNYRDVQIEVEETNTGQFGASLGFSTVENIFGSFSVTENNFNYKGLGCLWSKGLKGLRGGGEYAYFNAKIGAKSRAYTFSWTKPYFMDTPWSVGFDIERSSNRYLSKDYDINAWGLTLRAGYEINAFLRFGWHYRLRDSDVHVDDDGSSSSSSPSTSALASSSDSLEEEAHVGGLISASGVSLNYNSTDHPVEPCSGFRSRLEAEYAGIGGDHHFFGFAYTNAYYIPLGNKDVLKFRADFRFLQQVMGTKPNHIPLDERLFLGGDNSIRGYRPYKLGPRFKGGAPSGGLSMQIYSIEYSKKINKRLDGFTFFDAGHLSQHNWHFGRISTSVGLGVRMKIFEGVPPLTMGFGFPLDPQSRGEVRRFFMSVGGKF